MVNYACEGQISTDAQIVRHTWQYLDKLGPEVTTPMSGPSCHSYASSLGLARPPGKAPKSLVSQPGLVMFASSCQFLFDLFGSRLRSRTPTFSGEGRSLIMLLRGGVYVTWSGEGDDLQNDSLNCVSF